MPSRKRAKGRARRGTKNAAASASLPKEDAETAAPAATAGSQARDQNQQTELCRLMSGVDLSGSGCTHGRTPPPSHACSVLADAFEGAVDDAVYGSNDMMEAFRRIQQAIEIAYSEGPVNVQWTLSYFLSVGVNYVLMGFRNHAIIAAIQVLYIEHTFEGGNKSWEAKAFDILVGNQDRELACFFSRKKACDCLKKMYKSLKAEPAAGVCHSCAEEFERKKLLQCAGCRFASYCGIDCQKADWPRHRPFCESRQQPQKER